MTEPSKLHAALAEAISQSKGFGSPNAWLIWQKVCFEKAAEIERIVTAAGYALVEAGASCPLQALGA